VTEIDGRAASCYQQCVPFLLRVNQPSRIIGVVCPGAGEIVGAGGGMRIQTAAFLLSAGRADQFPKAHSPEIAFAGRSNVG
jgi:hypothetical protein